ncbi:hypothetical protein HDV05_007115 [Chytridiales sp. JEL 0842]|nr:hypothetical protein HDV05_007115 [Chytridiales sp. JEL 0842]
MASGQDLNSLMNKPRIHFGSLEEVERKRASTARVSNQDNGIDLDDLDAYDIGDSGRKAKAEHQAILDEFERKKLAREIAVPTDDRKVRAKLQSYSEPQTLFGEGPAERRDRLRELLSKLLQEGLLEEDEDEEMYSEEDSATDSDEEITEEFFTYADPGLLEARHWMAAWSVPRAQRRVEAQRAELDLPISNRKKMRHEWYTHQKTFNVFASQIGDERPLGYCTFSPNSKVLATGSWSGLVKLWSVPHSQNLLTLKGQKERVSGIDFHPGATLTQSPSSVNLVTAGADGTVNLHSFDSELPIGSLVGHELRVARAVFHPSGRYIGTSSFDQTWRIWDVEMRAELLLQEGHAREVFAIGFQGDGALVATGGMDAVGRVWDLRTGRSIMVLQGHVKPIITLDWSPNGYTIATGSEDNAIRIWDVRQAKCTYTVPAHKNLVSQVKFFRAGEGFESKGAAEGWTLTSEPPYAKSKKEGKKKMEGVEATNGDGMDEDSDEEEGEDEDVDMDPTGFAEDREEGDPVRRQILTGSHLVSSSYDGTCRIFSEGDWKPIKSLSGLEGKVMCCDVSKDGKYIATASYDRTFKLFASDNLVL